MQQLKQCWRRERLASAIQGRIRHEIAALIVDAAFRREQQQIKHRLKFRLATILSDTIYCGMFFKIKYNIYIDKKTIQCKECLTEHVQVCGTTNGEKT